jgi:hypothetical protein
MSLAVLSQTSLSLGNFSDDAEAMETLRTNSQQRGAADAPPRVRPRRRIPRRRLWIHRGAR